MSSHTQRKLYFQHLKAASLGVFHLITTPKDVFNIPVNKGLKKKLLIKQKKTRTV